MATASIPTPPTHTFTVDVEEYFHVGAFEPFVRRDHWDAYRSRADWSVRTLLARLARHGVKGTFFVLGWLAQRQPDLVRSIAAAGHEIASHGWSHRSIPTLSAAQFRSEVRTSKVLLESLSGAPVVGYRAPNFSIVPGGEWAFDVLLEEGYRYDSSLFVHRRRADSGYPGAPTIAHTITRPAGALVEFPIAAQARLGALAIPAAGGAYFRHFPYAVTQRAFRRLTDRGETGVFYIHPWELDAEQPRIGAPAFTQLRHYTGLGRTDRRLERLLSDFAFTSVARHTDMMRNA